MAKKDIQGYNKNSFLRRPYMAGGEVNFADDEYSNGDEIALFTIPKNVVLLRVVIELDSEDTVPLVEIKDEDGKVNTDLRGTLTVADLNVKNEDDNVLYVGLKDTPTKGKVSVLIEYIDKEVTSGRTPIKRFV